MLREVFFNSAVFVSEVRFEELLKGMTIQQAEEVDGNFVEEVILSFATKEHIFYGICQFSI